MEARTARAFPTLDRMVAFEAIAARSNLDLVQFVDCHLSQDGIASYICCREAGEPPTFTWINGSAADGEVAPNGFSRQNARPSGALDGRIEPSGWVSRR